MMRFLIAAIVLLFSIAAFGQKRTTVTDKLVVKDSIRLGNVTIGEISTDGTLGGNSDLAVPTEKAVKAYVDAMVGEAAVDTLIILATQYDINPSYSAVTSDGTETINFLSKYEAVRKISLASVNKTTLTFSNPLTGGIYSLHFTNAVTDTLIMPSNVYYPDGVKICTLIVSNGYNMKAYYDGTNYNIIDELKAPDFAGCFSYNTYIPERNVNTSGKILLRKHTLCLDPDNPSGSDWNSGTAYANRSLVLYKRKGYYNTSATSAGEEPTISNKWKPTKDLDILVPTDTAGKYVRYSIERQLDDYTRIHQIAYCTKATSSYTNSNVSAAFNPQFINGAVAPTYSSDGYYFTTTTGDYIDFIWYGTGIQFNYPTDNRGKKWHFEYIDGTAISNKPDTTTLSTYSVGDSYTPHKFTVFQHLPLGWHHGRATVRNETSGANTYGWFTAGSTSAFKTFTPLLSQEKATNVFAVNPVVGSNIEFAWRARLADSTGHTAQWLPEHSGVKTALGTIEVYVDGVRLTDSDFTTDDVSFAEKKEVRVVQKGQFIHSSATTKPLGNYISTHVINSKGVEYDVKVDWINSTYIDVGYINMHNLDTSMVDSIRVADTGISYAINKTGNQTYPTAMAGKYSYAAYGNAAPFGRGNFVYLYDFTIPARDWRGSTTYTSIPNAPGFKLYPGIFSATTFAAGTSYEFGGRVSLQQLINAESTLNSF